MDSPCNKCIVGPICKDPCEDMTDYLRDEIMAFKPPGSPVSDRAFLKKRCEMIRHKPDLSLQASLSIIGGKSCICQIFVKGGNVSHIVMEYIK